MPCLPRGGMIAAVCVAGLMTGCAAGGRGAPPTAAVRPPHAAAFRASSPFAAEMVDSQFPATGAEYADGARFTETVQQLQRVVFIRCMNAHGFGQRIPTVSPASIASAVAFDQDNTQFPNLAWIRSTGLFVPDTPVSGSALGRSGTISRTRAADERWCFAASAWPMRPVMAALGGLPSQWTSIIGRVERSAPVRAAGRGFAACVQRRGVPPGDAGSIDAFLAWVTGLQTHAADHAASVAVERHWVQAFLPCARKLVAVQEGLQEDWRRAFLRAHHAAVSMAEARAAGATGALAELAGIPSGTAGPAGSRDLPG